MSSDDVGHQACPGTNAVAVTIKVGDGSQKQFEVPLSSKVKDMCDRFFEILGEKDSSARFMYGSRILKEEDRLEEIMRYCSDKSRLVIRVLLAQKKAPHEKDAKTHGGGASADGG